MLIESFNHFTTAVTEEERTIIQSAFTGCGRAGCGKQEFEPEVCVYYDAWSNDNNEDPILSLIYEIIRVTEQYGSVKKSMDYLMGAAAIAEFFTGKKISNIVDIIRNKELLSEVSKKKEIHTLVAEFLDSLLSEQGNRLIIFIDELDRCKPEYAVRLLERIKHYFSNDRITFVFSVNIEELQHTVKRYYGEGFDACRYLDRFFDYRIELPLADMTQYNREIGLNERFMYEAVCKAVIKYCDFGLREIEKFYRTAKIAAYNPTHPNNSYRFWNQEYLRFSLCFIVPIIIGLRMRDTVLYNDFVSGKNSAPLIDILGDDDIAFAFCSDLLNSSETYDSDSKDNNTLVLLKDKLDAVYKAIFDESEMNKWGEIRVGKYTFDRDTKAVVLRTASLLSEFASY